MEFKTYNKKSFLLPESHRSMSCYHAKVMEGGIRKRTIHDCKRSIQLKNNMNDPDEIKEAIEKLNSLASGIIELREFIQSNFELK
jgi:hypothetical protein